MPWFRNPKNDAEGVSRCTSLELHADVLVNPTSFPLQRRAGDCSDLSASLPRWHVNLVAHVMQTNLCQTSRVFNWSMSSSLPDISFVSEVSHFRFVTCRRRSDLQLQRLRTSEYQQLAAGSASPGAILPCVGLCPGQWALFGSSCLVEEDGVFPVDW